MKLRCSIDFAPSLVLGLVVVLAPACGDDGSTSATATTTTTATTMTMTMGTTTATETATAAMTMGTTENAPTTSVGTDSATDPTTDATAGPTTDPTTGTTTDTGGAGNFCIHQCASDSDCFVDGQDLGLTCQDSFCAVESSAGCTDNAECVALFSGWTSTPCTSGGGECDLLGQICVQIPGGGGGCATPPGDFFMCDSIPGWAEMMVPDIDGNTVTVCGDPDAECTDRGYCLSPCKSDADCASPSYPICDTGTGLCGCGSDDHCATIGEPHLSVCVSGACGCGTDQQCVDGSVGDVCNEGVCGCSGDAACANVSNNFDGGMIVCRAP